MFVWTYVSGSPDEYLGMEFLGHRVISFIADPSIFPTAVGHFTLSPTSLIVLAGLYP